MSLTSIISLCSRDTLVFPSVQWLDDTNNVISIDSTSYEAKFDMFIETLLSSGITADTYTTGIHWVDSTSYTVISSTQKTIYLVDNMYTYINADTLLMVNYESMKVVGVGQWDSDNNRLPVSVLRGYTDLTNISYDGEVWHDTTALAQDNTRNWKGIIFDKYSHDTTAWDESIWTDTDALTNEGVPLQLRELTYTCPNDGSSSIHQKGDIVQIFRYRDSTACFIDDDYVYFQWPDVITAKPGKYMCLFHLINRLTGEIITLPNAASVCGNARYLILNIWRY